MRLQGVLFHDHPAPDTSQQIVLGDEMSAPLHQRYQQVEGVGAEMHQLPACEQAALVGLDFKVPKPITDRCGHCSHVSLSDVPFETLRGEPIV